MPSSGRATSLSPVVLALLLGSASPASAQPAAVPRASAEVERGHVLFGDLPRTAPGLVFFPRLWEAVEALQGVSEIGQVIAPQLFPASLEEWVQRQLEFEPTVPSGEPLVSSPALRSAGVDPEGPAVLSTSGQGAWWLGLTLLDAGRFRAWVEHRGATSAQNQPAPRDHGSAQANETLLWLSRDTEHPAVCRVVAGRGWCQFGAPASGSPFAELERFGTPSGFELGAALERASAPLPVGARAYLLLKVPAALPWARRALHERAERQQRFEANRSGRPKADPLGAGALALGDWAEAGAIAWYPQTHELRGTWSLTTKGTAWVAPLERLDPPAAQLAAWVKTPAVARVQLQWRPEALARAFRAAGWPLAARDLGGTAAFLMFGVANGNSGGEQPAASDGTILVPSALALSWRYGHDEARDRILHQLVATEGATALAPLPPVHAGVAGPALGGYQVLGLDELLVIGLGPGSGEAALRRLDGVRRPPEAAAEPTHAPTLEATLDLRALDEALAADEGAPGLSGALRLCQHLRRRFEPLLERFALVHLRAVGDARMRRLSWELEIGP